MGRKKKLYIPITRSGTSILASIFTQLLDEARKQRKAEIMARLDRGAITPRRAVILLHPYCCIWVIVLLLLFIYLIIWGCNSLV